MAMAARASPPCSAPSTARQSASAPIRPSSPSGWAQSGRRAVRRKARGATRTRSSRRLETLRLKLFRLGGDLRRGKEREEYCLYCGNSSTSPCASDSLTYRSNEGLHERDRLICSSCFDDVPDFPDKIRVMMRHSRLNPNLCFNNRRRRQRRLR